MKLQLWNPRIEKSTLEEDELVQRVAVIPEIFRSWLENAQSTEEDIPKTEVKHASKPVLLSTE